MKKILISAIALLTVGSVFAQKKVEDLLNFKETVFNFGKIPQGKPVTHDFLFTNISGEAVTIESASATCGCTTPVWPQPPVMAGKNDKITAGFNAASVGPFDKLIYVKVRGVDIPKEIRITGEVVTPEAFATHQMQMVKNSPQPGADKSRKVKKSRKSK